MSIQTGLAPGARGGAESMRHVEGDPDRTRAGALRVAAIFSDHMVLQHGVPVAVFGSAPSAEPVDITVTCAGEPCARISTRTDPDGRWLAYLPPLQAGGPYEMTVACGDDHITFHDVLAGEVWLASGQSNMELELRNSLDPDAVIAASADPLLRIMNVPKTGVVDEALESTSEWTCASPQTTGTMSAVAYYFAAQLRAKLGADMPVGIVDCYIGGTSVTCWMSRELLDRSEAGRAYTARYDAAIAGKTWEELQQLNDDWMNNNGAWPPPVTPMSMWHVTGAFEGMVRRVAPYTVRGVIWYQGEEDEAYADTYAELLTAMIGQWRGLWHRPDLPFIMVQLPQWYDKASMDEFGDPLHWPAIREAQALVARTVPHTSLVCLMDCGEWDNIHPLDKRPVGRRLAAMALADEYGMADMVPAARYPRMSSVSYSEPGAVTVTFLHASGLHMAPHKSDFAVPLESGFEVADESGDYMQVPATIESIDTVTGTARVRLEIPRQLTAAAVRYAWRSWGPAPLFNEAGLPAFPFAHLRAN